MSSVSLWHHLAVNKDFAVRKAGNKRKLAALLQVTPAAVSQWGAELPALQGYRLRELRPRWFAEWKRLQAGAQSEAVAPSQEAA